MDTIFNELINYGESSVRIVGTNDNPYFCGSEICKILGYKDIKKALQNSVKPKHKKTLEALGFSSGDSGSPDENALDAYRNGKAIYISEPGLYALISKCSLPVAEKFQDWIHEEVLPSIRKKGEYKLQKELQIKDKALEESALALSVKDKELEQLRFKTLQMTNYVTNVKIRTKREYIYIVSTKQYAANNNFKPGHTDNLKARLANYNTGQSSGDLFYYCYTKKVYEAQKLDKLIHDLLNDFKDTKKKENIIMHYTYLVKIIDFVIDHFNESFEFLNKFIREDLASSYELRPVIPEPINISTTIIQNGEFILLSDMGEVAVRELLLDIVESSRASLLTRRHIFEILEERYVVKGYRHKIWEYLKNISQEKKYIIKY